MNSLWTGHPHIAALTKTQGGNVQKFFRWHITILTIFDKQSEKPIESEPLSCAMVLSCWKSWCADVFILQKSSSGEITVGVNSFLAVVITATFYINRSSFIPVSGNRHLMVVERCVSLWPWELCCLEPGAPGIVSHGRVVSGEGPD